MGYYSPDNHLCDCEHCGQRLTGRQERYCSAACRQAAYRCSKQPRRREFRPCPLCGEPFHVTSRRKKFCDYYGEAEDDCRATQDDLDDAAWLAAEERRTAQCAHCGSPAGWSGRGHPRRFCSNHCKQADYRKHRAQRTA